MKIKDVVPYDDSWPDRYENQLKELKTCLGASLIEGHHVGSTSVVGLVAKPVIDILVVVDDLFNAIQKLHQSPFRYKGEFNIPFKAFYDRKVPYDTHVHVMQRGHPEIAVQLAFRDKLREDQTFKKRYAKLKQDLANNGLANIKSRGLFSLYTSGKNTLIKEILRSTGISQRALSRTAHEHEWDALNALLKTTIYHEDLSPNQDSFVLYDNFDVIGGCIFSTASGTMEQGYFKTDADRHHTQCFITKYLNDRKKLLSVLS